MKKEPLDIFVPPLLQIDSVEPSLERDGTVYARHIKASNEQEQIYEFRERNRIPVEEYIGKTAECILEILEAQFYYPQNKEEIKKLPKDVEKGEYAWIESGDKFIPELVEMVEGHQDEEGYEFEYDEFERLGINYLKNWGVSGLGLDIDQGKPMVKTANGVFLFNEYQNEELIDRWELYQPLYFKPLRMILRGMKIVEKQDWHKNKKEKIIVNSNEMIIIGRPKIIDP